MEESEKDGSTSYDFGQAWGNPRAYAIIKNRIMNVFIQRPDFNPENPYEELISTLTTTGLIHSAFELNKNLEVRYGWEMIDDENIVMHSCFGRVEKVDIRISGNDLGFLMNVDEVEFAAFRYKDIYWLCEAQPGQFR